MHGPWRLNGLVAGLSALTFLGAADTAAAQEASLRDRLRALARPAPVILPADPYADEKSADLARIDAEAARLFGPEGHDLPVIGAATGPIVIALLISDDCEACTAAQDELDTILQDQGLRGRVLTISGTPGNAALMERLTLDITPSYVMRDRLIRGHMPAIVLARYLSGLAPARPEDG